MSKDKKVLSPEDKELVALARKILKETEWNPPRRNQKEMPSIGLSCTCSGKMLPDPDCPLHCGDMIK